MNGQKVLFVFLTLVSLYVLYSFFFRGSESLKAVEPKSWTEKQPLYVIAMSDKEFDVAKANLESVGLSHINKFDAVRGDSLSEYSKDIKNVSIRAQSSIVQGKKRLSHADIPGTGAVGCYLSHQKLWEKVVKENLEGMYIFESDVSCIAPITDSMMEGFKKVDADLLFFGLLTEFPSMSLSSIIGGLEMVKLTKRFYMTHAYYITNAGAQKLLKYATPIEQQLDSYMSDILLLGATPHSGHGPLNAYFFNPQLCVQKAHKSSIQIKGVV
jgi:GR25 family glycosyltransferase involved in LPS biosynthesis